MMVAANTTYRPNSDESNLTRTSMRVEGQEVMAYIVMARTRVRVEGQEGAERDHSEREPDEKRPRPTDAGTAITM